MKIEREAKFENVDIKDVVDRLKKLDARKGYEGVMRITAYDLGKPGIPIALSVVEGEGTLSLIDSKAQQFLQATVKDRVELRELFNKIGLIEKKGIYRIPNGIESIEGRGMRFRLRSKSRIPQPDSFAEITLKTDIKRGKVRTSKEYETGVLPYSECREILDRFGMRALRTHDKSRTEYLLPGHLSVSLDTIAGVPTYIEIEGETNDDIARVAKELGYRMKDASLLSTRELREKYKKK